MNFLRRTLSWLVPLAAVGGLIAVAWFTRAAWQPWLESFRKPKAAAKKEESEEGHPHGDRVKITPQARKNLGIKPLLVSPRKEYWRKVQIPGVIVDRPGISDSGVTAPITGVVTAIHVFPGDTVKPGDPMFTLRLTSEFLQNTQAELHKLAKESQVNEDQIKRLEKAVRAGLAEARLIEARGQQKKVEAQIQANRQILQSRGLTPEQIDQAAEGKFLRSISVPAPKPRANTVPLADTASAGNAAAAYEIKELKVQLGDQVQAGQALALLSNHRQLFIEGRGFKGEAPLIARTAQNGWPVEAEFAEDDPGEWGKFDQTLTIHSLANAMDPGSRTFGFYVPLTNPSRALNKGDRTRLLWRFRPGQRVRLLVPVEKFENRVVLPAGAVVRDGEETYVFRVNGDAFDRKPVTVVYEDRHNVILDDADAPLGQFVAGSAAAALNRVLKAQLAGEGGGHAGHSH